MLHRFLSSLRRIGPRPALLLRYVAHQVARRVSMRLLRRTYALRVTRGVGFAGRSGLGLRGGAARRRRRSGEVGLRPWPLEIPRADRLPAALAPAAAALVAEADEVLAGRVDVLGSSLMQIGPEIDWHRDFKSGYRWPERFFMDVQVTRLDDDSDAKVPWDLSRCHHLLTLARAARLTGDPRYADEVERQLFSWLDANPTGHGINWVQPMEIGLRAVNWVWVIRTLEPEFPLSATLRERLVISLHEHGRHVAATLEGTPYLRSNHYLANILGLAVLGAALVGPEARWWSARARRAFERQIQDQVLEDGMDFESSVGYHGFVLEMFLIARVAATRRRAPQSPAFDARLRAMLEASRALRHPDGHVPLFGDVDSGRVLPAGFARRGSHDAILGLGAAILDTERLVDAAPDPEVAWTLGVAAWRALAARDAVGDPPAAALPDAGIYVLERDSVRAVVRCGDVGQNGNGGHAHNDVGSYELFWGERIVVDPGTYLYTADPAARNAFRSTAAHSTVSVDGEEINPLPDALFRLPQVARPSVREWSPGAAPALELEHDGYRRLPGSPIHRRRFELGTLGLTVIDQVDGSGAHELCCRVHLGPGVTARMLDERTVQLRTPGADVLRLEFGDAVDVSLEQGWVAPEYGVRERAQVVSARRRGELPAEIRYTFTAQARP
jgi:uncharacterized heparinase superfamily protein